jgi:hypothetical protein
MRFGVRAIHIAGPTRPFRRLDELGDLYKVGGGGRSSERT